MIQHRRKSINILVYANTCHRQIGYAFSFVIPSRQLELMKFLQYRILASEMEIRKLVVLRSDVNVLKNVKGKMCLRDIMHLIYV
jgi:hypothetical protein